MTPLFVLIFVKGVFPSLLRGGNTSFFVRGRGKSSERGEAMPLKDLRGKTVFDLEAEDFEHLFCGLCKEKPRCDRDFKTMNICQQLIDAGIWDSLYRTRQQGK